MTFTQRIFAVLTLVALPVCGLQAATPDSSGRLEALLKDFAGMSGTFAQQVTASDGEILQDSAGEFWLQRPGRIRWQTTTPFPQLLVSDGKKLWLYDEDLEQVTIKPVSDAVAGTPAFILSGNFTQLVSDYDVSDLNTGNGQAFTLSPKLNEGNYQYITLEFLEGKLATLSIVDTLSQKTRIDFRAVALNPDLSATQFSFTPPAGTDVLVDE